MLRRGLEIAAWLGPVLSLACADLATYAPNVCGNGVIEDGEDCDTYPDPALGSDLQCGNVGGACRYVCTADVRCPAGWACGDDGVCRHASGCYEIEGTKISVPPFDHADLADVTGDGRADLVLSGGGRISVLLGDSTRGLRSAFEASVPAAGAFALADLDLDGRTDLLVPVVVDGVVPRAGVEIYRGEDEGLAPVGSPDPTLFGGLTFSPAGIHSSLIQVNGLDSPHHYGPLLLWSQAGFDGLALNSLANGCASGAGGGLALLGSLPPVAHERTAGRVTLAHVSRDDPREIIAVPLLNEVVVFTATVTCGAPEPECPQFPCVEIFSELDRVALPPETVAAESGTTLLDVDGDGDSDLVISLETVGFGADVHTLAFALRQADGTMGPATFYGPNDALRPLADDLTRELDPCFEGSPNLPPVLAIGDLDGDGRPDLVTPFSILLAGPNGTTRNSYPHATHAAWSAAAIGDFDGDGHADVVVSVRSTRSCRTSDGLLLLEGDGTGAFLEREIAAGSAPRELAVGDYDGDRLQDLAVVEGSGELAVYFGGRERALTARQSVGSFRQILGIGAVSRLDLDRANDQRVHDISLLADGFATARVSGRPDRAMIAPYIVEGARPTSAGELAIAAGPLTEYAGTDGSIAPGAVFGADFVMFGSSKGLLAKLPLSSGLRPEEIPVDASDLDFRCASMAVRRLNPTFGSLGTLVAVDKTESGDTNQSMPLSASGCGTRLRSTPPTLMLVEATSGRIPFSVSRAPIGGTCSTVRSFAVRDIDGDGADDLLLGLGKSTADADCGHQALHVRWTLGSTTATDSELRIPEIRGVPTLQSAALLNADGDPSLEIVYFDSERISIADVDAARNIQPRIRSGSVVTPLAFPGASDGVREILLAGDVDGDGLDDIIQLSGETASIHRAIPHDRAPSVAACASGQ